MYIYLGICQVIIGYWTNTVFWDRVLWLEFDHRACEVNNSTKERGPKSTSSITVLLYTSIKLLISLNNIRFIKKKKKKKKVSVITSPPRTNTQVFPMSKPSFWNFAHQPPQIKIAPKGNGWKRNGSTDYIVISPLVSIPKTNVRLSVETSRAPFLHYSSFYRQPGIVSPLMAQKTMGRSLFFPHWPKIIMHVQKQHQHLPRYKPPQCPQNTPHQTTTHCAHIIHKARYIYFFHQNNTPYPLSNTPMPDESQKDETVVLSKISPAKNESW